MDFWIENIPYIDVSKNDREYLVTEPDNVVYIKWHKRIYPILFKNLTTQMLPAYLCFIRDKECENIISKVKIMFPIDKTKKFKMNNNPFEQAETYKTPTLEVYTVRLNNKKILIKSITPIYLESPPSSMHDELEIFSEYVEHYIDDNALQIPTFNTFFDYMVMVADEYDKIDDYDLNIVFYSPFVYFLEQLISKRITQNKKAIDIVKANEPDSEKYKKLKALGGEKEKTKWGYVYNPLFTTPRAKNRIDDFKKYLTGLNENSRIVDFGSGNGEILIGFGNHLKIKNNKNLIAMDRENHIQENAKALVSFFPIETGKVPINDIDLIMVLQVLHHIKKTPVFQNILHNINNKLKPGGYLFLREHDCRNIFIEKLINIEHFLYDVVLDSKSFEEAIQSLKDTAYMDVKHWHKTITENCPDLVFKDFNFAKTKTNPTLYFNMVYQKKFPEQPEFVPFDKNVIDASKKTILDYSYFTTMGAESRYSSLMPWHISSLLNIKFLPHTAKKIVDLTAHIGVDTIFYGILYPDADILAIENNNNTFLKLEYNLKKYGEILKRKGTFKALLADSSKLLDDPRITDADIVYIDPPWGGTKYKKETFIRLKLGDLDIINVVLKLLQNVPIVILKIPINFDKQSVYKSLLNKFNIKYFPVYANRKQSFGLFIFYN